MTPEVVLQSGGVKEPARIAKHDWGVVCIYAVGEKTSVPWHNIRLVREEFDGMVQETRSTGKTVTGP